MYDQTDESLRKRISRIRGNGSGKCASTSLLLRRFVFHMVEASAKKVTGDHNKPQGTMGRVQTAGEAPARSCVVFLAKRSFSWHGPIFGLFKS